MEVEVDAAAGLPQTTTAGLPDLELERWCVVGELGLDGPVHAVRSVLPIALAARAAGLAGLVVPAANAAEAALVGGMAVFAVTTLTEAIGHLSGRRPLPRAT